MNDKEFRIFMVAIMTVLSGVAVAEELRKTKAARLDKITRETFLFMAESELRTREKARNWWKFWSWEKS